MLALAAALMLSPMTRAEFFARLQKLSDLPTTAEVRRVLGPPDDILTEADPRMLLDEDPHIQEVWGYGNLRPGGFPTLGYVCVRFDGVAVAPKGLTDPPEKLATPEGALRQTIDLLGRTWPEIELWHGDESDPLLAIRLANRLLPLGKERILDAFAEYSRVTAHFGLSFHLHSDVLALLFSGLASPHPDFRAIPSLIFGDIPVAPAFSGFSAMAGLPDDVGYYVANLRRYGILRKTPVRPSDAPFAWLDELSHDQAWRKANRGYGEEQMSAAAQLTILKLLRTVLSNRDSNEDIAHPEKVLDQIRGRTLRWDDKNQRYIFDEGGILPNSDRSEPARVRWAPEILREINGRVLVTRSRQSSLNVTIRYDAKPKAEETIELVSDDKPVASYKLKASVVTHCDENVVESSSFDSPKGIDWLSMRLNLPEGRPLDVIVRSADGGTARTSLNAKLQPTKW